MLENKFTYSKTRECNLVINNKGEDVEYKVPFAVLQKLPAFQNTPVVTDDEIENYFLNLSTTISSNMSLVMEVDVENKVVLKIEFEDVKRKHNQMEDDK